jgi:hypothetical protein
VETEETAIARQRLDKRVSAATDMQPTIEELMFLYADIIYRWPSGKASQ